MRDGTLTLNGAPFQGIGANYFSLFSRLLKDPADRSGEEGLRQLSEAGIPFVRFMACGFWPVDWDLYLQDKSTYFRRLDQVVQAADRCRIGLIPSLFWNIATVPDLVGEPMDALGDPDSKAAAFIRQYTAEVVSRYRDAPAIWGWEFANECNLQADLPNAARYRPPVWPTLKTATNRTERDELSSQAVRAAFAAMAQVVRTHDTHRILITGNALPRPSAHHNTREKSWTRDSREQWLAILRRDNPDPFNTISVHVYPEKPDGYPAEARDLSELVGLVQGEARAAGKPLFVGEFGAEAASPDAAAERAHFLALLSAIETHHVPLSAFWVFDHSGQDKDWNVTFTNRRAYMLKLVGKANARMRAPAPDQKP